MVFDPECFTCRALKAALLPCWKWALCWGQAGDRQELMAFLFTAPFWRCSCCSAQQESATPDTQLYFQSHGGCLGWDDICSFRCFPGCSLSGWPNVLPISCTAVLVGYSRLHPLSHRSGKTRSQLGSLELQGCLVQRLFLFPWCTMWPHLGFL